MMLLRWACLNCWWYLFILLPYSAFTVFKWLNFMMFVYCKRGGNCYFQRIRFDQFSWPEQLFYFAMKYVLVAIFDWRVDIESIFMQKYITYIYIQLSQAMHSHKMYLLHWILTGNQAVLSIFNVNVWTLNPTVLELGFFHVKNLSANKSNCNTVELIVQTFI